MKTPCLLAVSLMTGLGAFAAAEKPDWENPAVNSRNRLPARTYAMPLASEAAALTDALEPETPYVQSLNGKWKFSWAGNPDLRAKDFWRADFNDADWFEIDVPSCVEMKGFGSPGYTNVRYPHANESQPTNEHFAAIRDRKTGKPDYNPVSSYRTRFTVPANWKGRDVILRFDGVYSAYNVWLNGQKVGYAEDSKLPSEFDITPFLKDENILCVEVFRWCDGSYFEDQDMFRFSGIFRDVTLWAKPKDGIEDFIVRTCPVNGYESWSVELELEKGGSATLYDAAFKKVGDLKPLSNSKLQLQLSPRLWSAEDPYLYTLVIKKGEDIRMKRVGFKEQKIVGNRFLVNGKPLKLHGVNRHEHSPANGRAVTREEMIADVTMMKRANIDTVRTSHYPNHRFFYDLCDRYGLYVVAEANVEGHEPGYAEKGLGRMPAWEHTIVERNLRHVAFYRNNPCVTLWSMGNETGHGDNFRHALAAVKALDPSRPTHWERGNPDADVDSRMYPWVYWLEERGKLADLPAGTPYSKAAWGQIGKSEGQSAGKPMMLCEYAHAMGNAIGNLEDYWKLFYRYDGLMGGCIWDWIDQAVWKATGRIDPKMGLAERYLAYGGDFDEEPNDGPFCCNGIIDAERHVTAKLVEVAHVYRPLAVTCQSGISEIGGSKNSKNSHPDVSEIGDSKICNLKFEIWNHALFTPANAYDGTWELLEDGVAVRHGTFAVPSVAPLARGTFAIPELTDFAFDPAKEYFVNFAFATRRDTLWAKQGFILSRDQVALAKVKGKGEGEQWWKNHTLVRPSPASSLSVAQDDKTVTVTAGGTKAVFCRATGTLCALEMDGVSVLGAATLGAVPGPQLTCMRAFVDNDQWLQAGCLASGLTQLRYHARPIVVEANRIRTSVEVTGSKSAGFTHTSEWTFAADGSLTIANHIEPHGTMPIPTVYDNGYQNFEGKGYLPRLGLSFRLAPALEQVAYYGRGPRENYIDRKTASFVGLWKSTVTDLAENYVRPQDNGMRTDVRWASFTDAQGRGVRFEMSEPIFLQALHCDREDLQYARHQNRQRRHITPVPVRPDVYLNLDLRQTGLGGNSCGPEPMNEGLYTSRPESWTVRMSPASSTAAAKASAAAERPLPGEPCTKLPVPPAPFPDRLSAFVWRNWGLVPVETLAQTVGATPADLNAIAAEMGLKANPVVLPEWKTKGYITVLRRNWHLLPYEQLLTVLGKTRDELYFSLMEDDFLWYKLGRIKPKCERLVYDKAEVEKSRGERLRIAQILKEEGLDPNAPEEPRFAFIQEIAAPSPASQPQPSTSTSSPFDFRLIFSYFADYGDPLADPEIGSFPEGLLQKLAAQGVNAVWLHTVLRTLAKDPKYPEFGAGSEKRIANLRTLVARAKKYGIRVFLYMNEPRAQPASFFAAQPWRASMKGSTDGDQFAMCTASPETRRWLSDSLEQVFRSVPGLGGIFTITMSENLTHCDARWEKKLCPRCKARPTSDLVVETNRAMIEGMLRGNPDAEAILYSWEWPEDEIETIMAGLPKKGCRVMCVSEHGMKIRRCGVDATESDYAISIVGPGEEATKVWNLARAEGIPCVAKVQAANSWEISSFPYIPTMDLVAQHASNLANAGVNGVMLSWSLGCCPSPNLAFYRDLEKGEKTPEGVLNRMAERLYGKANVAQVRRAWKAFSDGFVNYPFACQTIYNGPQQWGPANPLYWQKTDWAATMVGIPYDDLKGWRAQYPGETYAALMQKVADGFAEGCRLLEGIAPAKELAMFRAEQMHFASCADQTRFVLARDAGDKDGMRRAAQAELARAKAYWPLVRADSRIGYESSNHYFYVPRDVLEKVLSCRAADALAGGQK